MKVLPVFLLIIAAFSTAVFAQSGRRVYEPSPVPSSTPQIRRTQNDIKDSSDEAGYS